MEEEPSYTPPLTELMSLPFREDEADSSLPRESRKRERHVLADRDDRKEVRLTKAEFLGGLLSKQVFNTLNAWFYRKYDAAGFKFDSLKCFNIKRYASNEREVDRILDQAQGFLMQKELRALRQLMVKKDAKLQAKLLRRFCFVDKVTKKLYRRFIRLFPYGNSTLIRFTSINVDQQLYPILTLLQFRCKGFVKISDAVVKSRPALEALQEVWVSARDQCLRVAIRLMRGKYPHASPKELARQFAADGLIDSEGSLSVEAVKALSASQDVVLYDEEEGGEDVAVESVEGLTDLVELQDILGSFNADLTEIDAMKYMNENGNEEDVFLRSDESVHEEEAENDMGDRAEESPLSVIWDDDDDDDDDEEDEDEGEEEEYDSFLFSSEGSDKSRKEAKIDTNSALFLVEDGSAPV
jgi:hypothetical protein